MFHKNYHKGETYHHTAARENDISMALNQMCGFRLNGQSASSSGIVRISCYNSTSGKLASGSAVTFSESASLCGDSVPVEKCSNIRKPWAVLENTLEPNKIGSAIVAGATTVNVSGIAMEYITPDTSSPGLFKYSETGVARVLFSSIGKAVVLLGFAGTNSTGYDGPFACSLQEVDGVTKVHVQGGKIYVGETILDVNPESIELDLDRYEYCYIILKVEYIDWILSATIEKMTYIPLETRTLWSRALCKITYLTGYTLEQLWYNGYPEISGRWV